MAAPCPPGLGGASPGCPLGPLPPVFVVTIISLPRACSDFYLTFTTRFLPLQSQVAPMTCCHLHLGVAGRTGTNYLVFLLCNVLNQLPSSGYCSHSRKRGRKDQECLFHFLNLIIWSTLRRLEPTIEVTILCYHQTGCFCSVTLLSTRRKRCCHKWLLLRGWYWWLPVWL